jgi:hypothetical protein
MDIPIILNKMYPDAVWSIRENDYETLVWKEDSPKPSYEEILEAWETLESEFHNKRMEGLRKLAYEQESDPLFFKYQRGTAEKSDWLSKIQEIKDRYPYTAFSQQ